MAWPDQLRDSYLREPQNQQDHTESKARKQGLTERNVTKQGNTESKARKQGQIEKESLQKARPYRKHSKAIQKTRPYRKQAQAIRGHWRASAQVLVISVRPFSILSPSSSDNAEVSSSSFFFFFFLKSVLKTHRILNRIRLTEGDSRKHTCSPCSLSISLEFD